MIQARMHCPWKQCPHLKARSPGPSAMGSRAPVGLRAAAGRPGTRTRSADRTRRAGAAGASEAWERASAAAISPGEISPLWAPAVSAVSGDTSPPWQERSTASRSSPRQMAHASPGLILVLSTAVRWGDNLRMICAGVLEVERSCCSGLPSAPRDGPEYR
eukprot:scaffold11948_cov107-Isochrysis_galbana.AAC.4